MARIVIFANGELNQPERLKASLHPTDRIFCADGGTLNALALNLTPEIIIGDLDSLPAEVVTRMESAGVAIQRHPANKDQTDLELALELAVAQQPDEILLVTALGGRLDQMLANILLLTRPGYAGPQLALIDGPQQAILLRDHGCLSLAGRPGDTLSVVPLTAKVTGVTLVGVQWPLTNATLSLGSTWSISNQFAANQVTVEIERGVALVVYIQKTLVT
ncbi:MAG: Thiamine pyrophosphokinase [Anaerolineae bacterium]|nr:Thiamine pyrophosphokinase [Anaerolineae bacterium]